MIRFNWETGQDLYERVRVAQILKGRHTPGTGLDWRALGKPNFDDAYKYVARLGASLLKDIQGPALTILARIFHLNWIEAYNSEGSGANCCHPNQKTLGGYCERKSRTTIRKHLRKLEALGLIRTEHRGGKPGTPWRSNLYFVGNLIRATLYRVLGMERIKKGKQIQGAEKTSMNSHGQFSGHDNFYKKNRYKATPYQQGGSSFYSRGGVARAHTRSSGLKASSSVAALRERDNERERERWESIIRQAEAAGTIPESHKMRKASWEQGGKGEEQS